ncbi:MAG: ferrous iron transport protein B [FCB group bacterium]|jgi:ferrous iron transport protein B|nr:ferrous iron transport protein B [FCB group bacterium]
MGATFAVVGNPNVGKTTLFNALTGLSQMTGNYPGVTVERISGRMHLANCSANLIDLPGTYSLAARSPDEMIVTDVLLGHVEGEKPIDAVLAVVDATNLERNLYLVSQLQDLEKPVVVALNMMDIARKRGFTIDVERLSHELGAPVVPICAHKRVGIDELKKVLLEAANRGESARRNGPEYPAVFHAAVDGLAGDLSALHAQIGRTVPRAEAFRVLVDQGGYAEQRLLGRLNGDLSRPLAQRRQEAVTTGSPASVEVRSRYAWIRNVVSSSVQKPAVPVVTFSDRLDRVLTHKIFGIAIFALLMMVVFQAIYTWAAPFMDIIDQGFSALGGAVGSRMPEGILRSLVVDGMIAGVGSVLVFVPQILILTLFIALLEDCGYMARAAFLMDRILSRVGLSGQSFIPLLSSFACAIPGIMATRTIANRRDRFTTMLVAPLMSCAARLPVYTIMIAAFIPARTIMGGTLGLQGITLFCMYALGMVVAIPMALLLKRTLLRGETPPFILELPSYKWPQAQTVLRRVFVQGWEFLRRAGTVIFAITIVVWALAYFPHSSELTATFDTQRAQVERTLPEGPRRAAALAELDGEEAGAHLRNSYFGRMGQVIEPVVTPLGWDWRIGMSVIASFPAREIIVATMGTVFNIGSDVDEKSDTLKGALQGAERAGGGVLFSIPVALSIMVFFALCCQCGATLVMLRRETRTWRWPAFTFAYMTVLAYAAAFVTYQATSWLGWGT